MFVVDDHARQILIIMIATTHTIIATTCSSRYIINAIILCF
ncbi:hypothetical protein [Ferruginibacter sp.]